MCKGKKGKKVNDEADNGYTMLCNIANCIFFCPVLHTVSGGTVSKWFPKYDPRDEDIGWKNIYEGSQSTQNVESSSALC